MLELKELLEEREAPKQERAQKLNKEELAENRDYKLLKQNHDIKRKNRNFLEFYKRVKFNPRYFEEYEQLLRRKEFLREYYGQFQFLLKGAL